MAEITRDLIKNIRGDIDEALKVVGEKYGVKLSTGNASFTAGNATMKLEIAAIVEGGKVISKEVEDFNLYCRRYGMTSDHLGKTFKAWNGIEYTIIGCRPRASKSPIIAKDSFGKRYKFPALAVLQGLGVKDPQDVLDIAQEAEWEARVS